LDKLRFGARSGFESGGVNMFDVGSLNWDDFSVSDGRSGSADGFVAGWDLFDPAGGAGGGNSMRPQDFVFGMA
jgi:hypothetical protein